MTDRRKRMRITDKARKLYLKYGFTVYGTRPHGMKYPDGSYDYLMIKMIK